MLQAQGLASSAKRRKGVCFHADKAKNIFVMDADSSFITRSATHNTNFMESKWVNK